MAVNSVSLRELLEISYQEATKKNGLRNYTQEIRTVNNDFSGKYCVKRRDLNKLFSSNAWIEMNTKNGHRKLKHRVTKIVIEYASHSNDIDPGAAKKVYDQVQEHLDILKNIFDNNNNWETPPDYDASSARMLNKRFNK